MAIRKLSPHFHSLPSGGEVRGAALPPWSRCGPKCLCLLLPKGERNLGFTLVELLVVITIIAILLALLMPAMDQAVYQAELTVCGANQHGIGTGLISYAIANKNGYPDRPDTNYAAFHITPTRVALKKMWGNLDNLLTCPLASPRPLPYERSTADQTISTYNLWFDFKFSADTGDLNARVMRKLGQRFTYLDEPFSALASDRDVVHVQNNEAQSSHPDKAGLMWNSITIDDVLPTQQDLGPASTTYLIAIWYLPKNRKRGPTDDNFLNDDGAVRRINDITWDEKDLSHVPIQNNASRSPPNGYMFLPRVQ